MNIQDLLHKRILVGQKSSSFSQKSTVEEIKILEIAPSANWVKIQNMDGRKYWKHVSDIQHIETLNSVEKSPSL